VGQHLVEQGPGGQVVALAQRQHRRQHLHRPRVGVGERLGRQQGGGAIVIPGQQRQPQPLPAAHVRPGAGEQRSSGCLAAVAGVRERVGRRGLLALRRRRPPLVAGPQAGLRVGRVVRVRRGQLGQVGQHGHPLLLVGEHQPDAEHRATQVGAELRIVDVLRGPQVVPGGAVAALLGGQAECQQQVRMPPVRGVVRGQSLQAPRLGVAHVGALHRGDRAAAGALGLGEPADVGHRLDPMRAVLHVQFRGGGAPGGFEVVEQRGCGGEVIQLAGRDRLHQHRGLVGLRAGDQLQGQPRVLDGEQVGGPQGRVGPGRGEPHERLLELGEAADRGLLAASGLVEAVQQADQPDALVVAARPGSGHLQRGRPRVPGERLVIGPRVPGQGLGPLPELRGHELQNVLVVGELLGQLPQRRHFAALGVHVPQGLHPLASIAGTQLTAAMQFLIAVVGGDVVGGLEAFVRGPAQRLRLPGDHPLVEHLNPLIPGRLSAPGAILARAGITHRGARRVGFPQSHPLPLWTTRPEF